ncbi:zonular occludens toxin domain-containing protein [Paralysiella testudinis]
MLKNRKDLQGRPLYIDGIPEVDPDKIPHEPLPEGCNGGNWHEWLPTNAIIVIDECQRYWRQRSNGSTVPPAVQAMETHRHKGVDIFLLTQHPRLIDINVKSFVENHVHLSKSQLGNRRSWEWQKCGNPDNKGDVRDALVKPYTLDKNVYGLYKSAELHTKIKTGRSMWVYLFPIALLAAIGLGTWAFLTLKNQLSPQTMQQVAAQAASEPAAGKGEADAAPQTDAGHYPQPQQQQPDPQEAKTLKAEDFQPALDGKPWTAPVYAPHNTSIQTMPFPVGCIKSGNKCTCYTDQATPIRGMDKGLCLDFAENGIYNPYKQPQQAVQTTANTAPAPAPESSVMALDSKARPDLMPPPFTSVQ